ncbi:hypothetical protein E1B28_008114 [Marasmius oreades]|uniref:Amine oxidase domain-containing protein n=1 Tax=Marasmius oreades TaxID=181124 RepID=A0A9P7URS5_9AGAR|nr:uncharacterized protein E1B28_008114 [Marasmius oreades]KAG7091713.1 hypothetical protein E1B28_008114 [Marasmius oreades]
MDSMLYRTKNDNTNEVFKLHSKNIIENYQKAFLTFLPTESVAAAPAGRAEQVADTKHRIAVIGAGVSGLLVAMRLADKGMKVDVYEASNRTGGRLYTYKFPGGGEWDYFDIGAMRFPDTAVMKPTYDLFKELEIPLLNYQMHTDKNWLYYNDIRVKRGDAAGQDFGARESKGGTVPDEWVNIGISKLMDNVYGRFLAMLRKEFKEGYKELMKYDEHSTRSFMAFVHLEEWVDSSGKTYPRKDLYPTSVINWLETMTYSTGWFDRAFSETVLEALAFAEGLPKPAEFRCVKDGSQRVTDKMVELLKTKFKDSVAIYTGKPVASVTYDPPDQSLSVTWKDSTNPNTGHTSSGYSQVVLTISPQSMRQMDLSTCRLDYGQRNALRMLQPGPSIKIGMKFKRNWWADQQITGGQSVTDRSARAVVYPSHGSGESTVLIASYCWSKSLPSFLVLQKDDAYYTAQDARNLGAWIDGLPKESYYEERLRDLILGDLSAIHGIPLADIKREYDCMYAYDWAQNPQTIGAYAFFGPGQFSSLYANLTRPAAGGRLHFAGEAISTCHAWVAGAVESANRVVNQIQPASETLEMILEPEAAVLQLAISDYLQKNEEKR